MEVHGYIDLTTTFGEEESAKTVVLRYMIIAVTCFYNIIVGRPTLNALMAAISYPDLFLKFPLAKGKVGIVRGDEAMARRCYAGSAKVKTI